MVALVTSTEENVVNLRNVSFSRFAILICMLLCHTIDVVQMAQIDVRTSMGMGWSNHNTLMVRVMLRNHHAAHHYFPLVSLRLTPTSYLSGLCSIFVHQPTVAAASGLATPSLEIYRAMRGTANKFGDCNIMIIFNYYII